MSTRKKRIENKELIDYIKENCPCLVCMKQPVDPHHIIHQGAGGHDLPENLMPLCRIHHSQLHAVGLEKMAQKNESIKKWLVLADWEWDGLKKKWTRYGK